MYRRAFFTIGHSGRVERTFEAEIISQMSEQSQSIEIIVNHSEKIEYAKTHIISCNVIRPKVHQSQ